MADAATLEARLDELRAAQASGVLSVTYEGRTVTYRSMAELEKAIAAVEKQLAKANGTRRVRQVRVVYRGKGL